MFLGVALCYVVFKAWYFWRQCNDQDLSIFGDQKFNPFIWAILAMCDLCATSIMYVGLTWTYAASFQMLMRSVIIFTGFSVCCISWKQVKNPSLDRNDNGLAVVGVEDYIFFPCWLI